MHTSVSTSCISILLNSDVMSILKVGSSLQRLSLDSKLPSHRPMFTTHIGELKIINSVRKNDSNRCQIQKSMCSTGSYETVPSHRPMFTTHIGELKIINSVRQNDSNKCQIQKSMCSTGSYETAPEHPQFVPNSLILKWLDRFLEWLS